MATRKKIVIDEIQFNPDEPTTVPMTRLYTWVIWQFPACAMVATAARYIRLSRVTAGTQPSSMPIPGLFIFLVM